MNNKQIFYVISCVSGCAVLIICEWFQGNKNTKWLDYIRFSPITDKLVVIAEDSELDSASPIMQDEFTLRDELQKALGKDWYVCSQLQILNGLEAAWKSGVIQPIDN